MDFALDQDQSAIRDLARSFAADEMAPHAAAWDAEEIFPVDVLRRAASLGLATIYVGDEYGGSGLGRLEAAIIFEELSAGCVSTAAYLSIHNMCAWMIDQFADDALRARILPHHCAPARSKPKMVTLSSTVPKLSSPVPVSVMSIW